MAPRVRFYRNTAGRRIAYAVDGDGPLLVLPAWWVSHVERDYADPAFRGFFDQLATRLTVVRYDRLGVGLSDRERGDRVIADELTDLKGLVDELIDELGDELGAERVALFGMSCGGPLAVAYAALHPERTSHLVLCGSYVCGRALATDELKAAMIALVRANWGLGAKAMVDLFAPEMTPAEAQGFVQLQRESASTEMAAALLDLTYAMDVAEQVALVRAPTLVLHRRKDRAIPFEHGRDLAARIRGATLVPLDGSSHLPWIGDGAVIATAVLDFVAPRAAAARAPAGGNGDCAFVREGDIWSIAFAGRRCHLKHARGLGDLAVLVGHPDQEIQAMHLMDGLPAVPPARTGADDVLDERALAELRARLRALDAAIERAEAGADAAAAVAAGDEREALVRELRAATGLRGRRRTLGDPTERARKAVTGRIRESIDKLREVLPELARHFDEAIVTGTYCAYAPPRPMRWRT